MTDRLRELIDLGDPNEMLREVDRRARAEDWEGLVDLSARCRLAAVERGKPLSGAASYGEYRLGLDGPGEYIEYVIDAELGRFGLGPMAEVVASSHDWDEIEIPSTLTPGWESLIYECVARGDDPGLDASTAAGLVDRRDLPLELASWEPRYTLANYHDDWVEAPRPLMGVTGERQIYEDGGELLDDADAVTALIDLVRIWQDDSNGQVAVVAAEGSIDFAIANVDPEARNIYRVNAQSAVDLMAWAGASGGAQGRRAGMAVGRSKAWWAIASLAGQNESWPPEANHIGRLAQELSWYTWDIDRTTEGFTFALGVVDNVDGASFAIYATDEIAEDEEDES